MSGSVRDGRIMPEGGRLGKRNALKSGVGAPSAAAKGCAKPSSRSSILPRGLGRWVGTGRECHSTIPPAGKLALAQTEEDLETLSGLDSNNEVVRLAGLEPANWWFSEFPVGGVSLPFIAHRYTRYILYLQAIYRN